MTTREKMEIMQAYLDGKAIQMKFSNSPDEEPWHDCDSEPVWDWLVWDYRIRPHEKFTPEWFAEEMARLAADDDVEDRHYNMDALMCELLEHLGYSKGTEIFDNTEMWYA